MSKEKFALYAAVYILLEKEGKILLLRRYNTGWEDGKYTLPAGHFDGGETVKAAAAREAREETGVEIQEEDLDIVHVLHINTDKEYISYFLKANTWKGEPTNTEPEKSDDMKWFPMDNLPENTLPFIRDVLDAYQAGVMFSEAGFGTAQTLNF